MREITFDLSDDELVKLAHELANQPREQRAYRADEPFTTIATSDQDQTIPDGIDNPLWQIVRELPADRDHWSTRLKPDGHWAWYDRATMHHAYGAGLARTALCSRYTWSIPSPGDIAWIKQELHGRAVVEIGAGAGYWAWQLGQAGIDVAAYDPHEPGPENRFARHRLYTQVNPGDHTATGLHPDRALMLCWPSYGADFAELALRAYEGDMVIYIGEGESGCCADDGFFAALEAGFEESGSSPHHVTWDGIHCRLAVWRRR